MREVNFIESVNVRKVMCGDWDEFRYRSMETAHVVGTDMCLCPMEQPIKDRVVPVNRFCKVTSYPDDYAMEGVRYESEETFIAYSEDVEKLLGVPISSMVKELEEARREIRNLYVAKGELASTVKEHKSMPLKDRIKFLFGRSG